MRLGLKMLVVILISTTVKDYKINAANNYSSSAIEYINGILIIQQPIHKMFLLLEVGGDLVVTGSITGLKVQNIDVDGIVTAAISLQNRWYIMVDKITYLCGNRLLGNKINEVIDAERM